jgi:hypothetical protein
MGMRRNQESIKPPLQLLCKLRPLTIADMVSGYTYEPGMSVLQIGTPALGRDDHSGIGLMFDMPLLLPPDLRENTPENVIGALALACMIDPEVRQIVEHLKGLVRASTTPAASH